MALYLGVPKIYRQMSKLLWQKSVYSVMFLWRIWPFECLVLMILTITKYFEIGDRAFTLLSTVIFLLLVFKMQSSSAK